jgi:hypothetical protein
MLHLASLLMAAIVAASGGGGSRQGDSSLAFKTIEKSNTSGIQQFEGAVARSKSEWASLWSRHKAKHRPPPVAPAVDFSTQQVMAVFLGSRPSGCYSISITAVHRSTARLLVTYRESGPPADAFCTQAIVNPAHLVTVARSPLPVVFQAERSGV